VVDAFLAGRPDYRIEQRRPDRRLAYEELPEQMASSSHPARH
jgi:hypothetical protein